MSVEKLIVKTRETTANDPTKPGRRLNELEALRDRVVKLKTALKALCDRCDWVQSEFDGGIMWDLTPDYITAREILEKEGDK